MSRLSLNVSANLVGRAWPSFLSILFVPLYLRFIGIEAYGLVGFYSTLQGVLGLLDLGIGLTMTRELARLSAIEDSASQQRDLVRTLEIIYWVISCLGGLTVFCLAPVIASHWVKFQELSPDVIIAAVRTMGLAAALQLPFSLYQGGLMGLQRQVLVNVVLVVVGTLRAGGAVLVLWLISPTITAFMEWQVLSGIIGSTICMVLLWRSLPIYPERAVFKKEILYDVWKYAASISANAVIGVVISQLDKVILSKMLTLTMFGYYSLSSTVASAIWMLIVPFNSASFPQFVQIHEKGDKVEMANLFHRCSQFLSFLMLPIAALLLICSREILMLWTHDANIVNNCWQVASILVLGTTINGICSVPVYAASAFGWPQLMTSTNLLQAFVIVPLIIILAYYWQSTGAAIAWVLLNCTYLVFLLPRFFRKHMIEEKFSWYTHDEILPAVIAISVCFIMSNIIADHYLSTVHQFFRLILIWLLSFISTGIVLPHVRNSFKLWIDMFIFKRGSHRVEGKS